MFILYYRNYVLIIFYKLHLRMLHQNLFHYWLSFLKIFLVYVYTILDVTALREVFYTEYTLLLNDNFDTITVD